MEQRTNQDTAKRPSSESVLSGKRLTRRTLLASLGAAAAAAMLGTAGAAIRHSTIRSAPGGSAYAGNASLASPAAAAGLQTEMTAAYPQVDFVRLLRDHNETASELYAKVTGNRSLEVLVPFKGKRCAHYAFAKDPNDDFIKMLSGSVSLAEPVFERTGAVDYAAQTGTWVTGFPPNEYTTEIGATFSFTFDGTGFDFRHYTDNRGGVWEFGVDGQPLATVSTHIDAVPAGQVTAGVATRPVARGLSAGTHTVIATFRGADPDHAPSGGTARGWVRSAVHQTAKDDIYRTAYVYGSGVSLNPVKLFDALHSWSNKEFALSVTPAGSSLPSQFLPEHSNIGTVFAVAQRIYFDHTEITSWTAEPSLRPVKSVTIVQQLVGRHPADPANPLADISCVHTITARGVSVKVKITWLRDVLISTGYGMMFPVFGSFARTLVTGCGNSYNATATDGSTTDLTEGDQAGSYAFIPRDGETNGARDTVVAMTIHDSARTLRMGQPGRRRSGSILWLQHRDADMQKLYPHVFDNYTAAAGETYEAGGTFFIGELPLAGRFYG